MTLEAISTPGHCDGHYVLRLEGRERSYLFASDLVFWGGAIILQNVPDANLQAYAASMNRVAELEFDALLPGHHMISLANGKRHVEAAATTSIASGCRATSCADGRARGFAAIDITPPIGTPMSGYPDVRLDLDWTPDAMKGYVGRRRQVSEGVHDALSRRRRPSRSTGSPCCCSGWTRWWSRAHSRTPCATHSTSRASAC